jgi:hypothetical protein
MQAEPQSPDETESVMCMKAAVICSVGTEDDPSVCQDAIGIHDDQPDTAECATERR